MDLHSITRREGAHDSPILRADFGDLGQFEVLARSLRPTVTLPA